jgi:predicted DNA-binding transcriptional regulator AlpA
MADLIAHWRLRTRAAAAYLGYSESTLEKKRVTGEGPPFIRLGRAVVYDTRDLDAWLGARRATSTSDPRLRAEPMPEKEASARLPAQPRQGIESSDSLSLL